MPSQPSIPGDPGAVSEPLWTVNECAAYLRRSPRWIWNHLHFQNTEAGSIPHMRLPGGAPRFVPSIIRQWLEDGCPPATHMQKMRKR